MLLSLTIQDFVIIKNLALSLQPGLSALTGETGAGKSILLDALGVVLGNRSESGFVRQGCAQAVVSAEFSLPRSHPLITLLEDQGFLCPQDSPLDHPIIFIRRVLQSQGRTKAFINDHPVNITFLKDIGQQLVEIHGQFDRLLDVSSHRRLLDAFGDQEEELSSLRHAYTLWKEAQQEVAQAAERLDHLKHHEDFLRYQLKELENLHLKEGEEETLLKERESLSGLAKMCDALNQACSALHQSQSLEALQTAHRALQKISPQTSASVDIALGCLEKAISEVTEALAQLEELQTELADQPQRLQQMDDRLHQLRAVARKHHKTVDQLPVFFAQLSQDLEDLDQAEHRLHLMEKKALQLKDNFLVLAQNRHQKRRQWGNNLDQAVMAELPALKLPHARFETEVTVLPETEWHETGIDRVRFLVAMNRGQDLCPLEKTASGGELARLMLSLKAILSRVSYAETLIFDEIDIGVGGAVAAAIGQRLAALSQEVQVLAITHSPQVAAAADHHYQVTKVDDGTQVVTHVTILPLPHRHEEIARLLSGEEITNEARAAARSLLSRYG